MKDGIRCECGEFHPFTEWIRENWDQVIKHTCSCGRKRKLLRGEWMKEEEKEK